MLPAPCSSCGTPLPAVASDPFRPDLCPSCAARSAGVAPPAQGAPPPTSGQLAPGGAPAWSTGQGAPPQAPAAVRVRAFDGILTGVAAAAVGGAAWWGVVAATSSYYPYLALVVGVLVGRAVVEGTRKGGVVPGLIALVCCAAGLVVAQYFGSRSMLLSEVADQGGSLDLPLWNGFDFAKELLKATFEADKLVAPFLGIGAVAALFSAGASSRRASLH